MSEEIRQELAELAAGLRAHLQDGWVRGARVEALLPDPPQASGADPAAAPAERTEGRAPAPDPTRWAAWAQAARQAPMSPAERLRRIREELGDCRRCALAQERRNLVFGAGDPQADLVVVGMAPQRPEDSQGIPFAGEPGEMLDKMLVHVLGLQRDQVYLCQVVMCRPPRDRAPAPDEVQACRPFLEGQLGAVAPKLILAMGRGTLAALAADAPSARRGEWTTWKGIPVLPTYHPADLIAKPERKRPVFEDLKALRARYDALGGRRAGG